jgi:hypothetical protein
MSVFVAIAGLGGSLLAAYISIQTDISNLKLGAALGKTYQEETNQRLSQEIKDVKAEHRESAKELNEKADRIIENLRAHK